MNANTIELAQKIYSLEDLIGFMESQVRAAKEHRRMAFIYRVSPRLYQKIILRQLQAADDERKQVQRTQQSDT